MIMINIALGGKFKRTLTPWKVPSEEDREKVQEEIHIIFNAFKKHIQLHRPQIDIEKVATGETWFGEEALQLKLCDKIATVDEVLLQLFKDKHTLYLIKKAPPEIPSWLQIFVEDANVDDNNSSNSNMRLSSTLSHIWNDLPNIFFEKFWCWLQKRVMKEVVNNNSSGNITTSDIASNVTNSYDMATINLNNQQLSHLFNYNINNKNNNHNNSLSMSIIEEAVTDVVPPPSMTQMLAIDTTHKYKSK